MTPPPKKIRKLYVESGESSCGVSFENKDEKECKNGDYVVKFKNFVSQHGYDIVSFFKQNPQDSQLEFKIPMNTFDEKKLKNIVLFNICRQEIELSVENINLLILFFKSDFNDDNRKAYLEVLVHLSKMDTDYYNKIKLPGQNLPEERSNKTLLYNKVLNSYLKRATTKYGASEKISKMDEEKIKGYLKKPILFEAWRQTMELLFKKKEDQWSDLNLSSLIDKVTIYRTTKFVPYEFTRGACLTNGLLICEANLPPQDRHGSDYLYKADLITLMGHEFTHFLARSYENNYNFSTPYKNPNEPVYDICKENLFFESGRMFELLLYNNIQPNYLAADDDNAAKAFLERLDTHNTLPMFSSAELESLEFKVRGKPSVMFAVDLIDEPPFLYD